MVYHMFVLDRVPLLLKIAGCLLQDAVEQLTFWM